MYALCIVCSGQNASIEGSQLEIRPCRTYDAIQDKDAIITIFQDSWYYLTNRPTYDIGSVLDQKATEDNGVPTGVEIQTYVCTFEERPVGFMVVYLNQETHLAFIRFLCIQYEYRGQGYGRALLTFGLSEVKKHRMTATELRCNIENLRAQALYKKVGFQLIDNEESVCYFRLEHA